MRASRTGVSKKLLHLLLLHHHLLLLFSTTLSGLVSKIVECGDHYSVSSLPIPHLEQHLYIDSFLVNSFSKKKQRWKRCYTQVWLVESMTSVTLPIISNSPLFSRLFIQYFFISNFFISTFYLSLFYFSTFLNVNFRTKVVFII